eukprot:Sspe_Gene.1095::Locus_371_Transcript_1_1_Confidence_1.000_Length_1822::g.1095::m.1095/K03251/EIF3D; translation initiation factor 3 subunit D
MRRSPSSSRTSSTRRTSALVALPTSSRTRTSVGGWGCVVDTVVVVGTVAVVGTTTGTKSSTPASSRAKRTSRSGRSASTTKSSRPSGRGGRFVKQQNFTRGGGNRRPRYADRRNVVHRMASIEERSTWQLVGEHAISELARVNETDSFTIPKGEDLKGHLRNILQQRLKECGDEDEKKVLKAKLDEVTAQPPMLRPLPDKLTTAVLPNYTVDTVQTSVVDDQCVRLLAKYQPVPPEKISVYAPDVLIATLMVAPKSVNSWDFAVQRFNNMYFFFLSKEGSALEYWTVNENALDPPPEKEEQAVQNDQKINTQQHLRLEATNINQNFLMYAIGARPESKTAKMPLPKYREFRLSD